MSRFIAGARVRVAEEHITGSIGTVIEVLIKTRREDGFDRYRVQFPDGTTQILSDLELSAVGSGPTKPLEDVA
jgi:hypothetical protein